MTVPPKINTILLHFLYHLKPVNYLLVSVFKTGPNIFQTRLQSIRHKLKYFLSKFYNPNGKSCVIL